MLRRRARAVAAEDMSAAAVAEAAEDMPAAAVAVVAAAVVAAAGVALSIHLKEDIVPLVRLNNGLELYRFRYKGGRSNRLCGRHGARGAAN